VLVWDDPIEVVDNPASRRLIQDASVPPRRELDTAAMNVSPADFRSELQRGDGGANESTQPLPIVPHFDSAPQYTGSTGMAVLENMEGQERATDDGFDWSLGRLSRSFNGPSHDDEYAPNPEGRLGTKPPNWRNRLSFETVRKRPPVRRGRVGSTDDALLFLRDASRKASMGGRGRLSLGGRDDLEDESGGPETKIVVVEVSEISLTLFFLLLFVDAETGLSFFQRLETVEASAYQRLRLLLSVKSFLTMCEYFGLDPFFSCF
jgi:hypothetical protein